MNVAQSENGDQTKFNKKLEKIRIKNWRERAKKFPTPPVQIRSSARLQKLQQQQQQQLQQQQKMGTSLASSKASAAAT